MPKAMEPRMQGPVAVYQPTQAPFDGMSTHGARGCKVGRPQQAQQCKSKQSAFALLCGEPLVHNTGFGCPVTQAQHFDTLCNTPTLSAR